VIAMRVSLHLIHLLYLWKQQRKKKKNSVGPKLKTSGARGSKKDDSSSSSSTSLEHSVSLDHQHDPDWLKKGRKDVDVGGRKSDPDLHPATKPLQCEPRIHYLLPINRVPKDSTLGKIHKVESVKKTPEEQPTPKKRGRPRKGSSPDEASKAKKENRLRKRKLPGPKM